MSEFLRELFAIIEDRKVSPKANSYTNHLLDGGQEVILQKVGEEAIEVLVAAGHQSDERLIEEIADLAYHCLVLLASRGLSPDDVTTVLQRRFK